MFEVIAIGNGAEISAVPTSAARPSASPAQATDERLREIQYRSDKIYRLLGVAGYEIDVCFSARERLVGLGAGDIEGIAFRAEGNHLFLKPKARHVHTNLTVITSARTYHFEYLTTDAAPPDDKDVLYALNFVYPTQDLEGDATKRMLGSVPSAPVAAVPAVPAAPAASTGGASTVGQIRARNEDYWYCGHPSLKPSAAWDDGVQTHLLFDPRADIPAIFARSADGAESLVNFSVRGDEVIVQRIARRFILRRGRLSGCVVNRSAGALEPQISAGTLLPGVGRMVRRPATDAEAGHD